MNLRYTLFKEHLEEGEQILEIVHKHWFVIIRGVMRISVLYFLVPFGLFILFSPFDFFFWLMIVWMTVGILRMLYFVFNWYLDAWILTNVGIIDVRWEGFFKRSAERIEYKSIEQVGYAFSGFWETVLGYGTVQIQQPGGLQEIKNIASPKRVASLITQYEEKFVSSQKFQEEEVLKDILTGIIKRHIDKHGLNINVEEK